MNGDTYWATACRVCSDEQLQALVYRDLYHLGTRRIAHVLKISRGAVRDRLEVADRRIADATRKEAA